MHKFEAKCSESCFSRWARHRKFTPQTHGFPIMAQLLGMPLHIRYRLAKMEEGKLSD